jgi:xanthine dehydrogenase small subunit
MTDTIQFLLDGRVQRVRDLPPTTTVLSWLREHRRRTGTKEGCAEGDCGACTVVLGELAGDEPVLQPINACIRFLPTLDGKALFTVEDLCRPDGALHPVQQAMVDCHGSQCGFCTPGFVMSLWSVYLDHERTGQRPDRAGLCSALSGNLCRCTGYKPILDAGEKMFELPPVAFEREALRTRLQALRRDTTLHYEDQGRSFYAPRNLAELTRLRAELPEATVLAGCTDIGLWVNKQFRELGPIIYIGEVAELKTVTESDGTLRIGAGVSLTAAWRAIAPHYPEMDELWERFASRPIRNAGTLGGNVANGSPIGDSMPALIAAGARVVLRNRARARTLALEDLYLDYMKKAMQPDEIVEAIELPLPEPNQRLRCYKLSKRYDSDISAVFAGFRIELDGERIAGARIAYGGMAATPKRAARCEAALVGQNWTETTVRRAMDALSEDYTPLSDMRASADYRMQTARNLLYRYYLETRPDQPLSTRQLSAFAAA